MYVSKVGPWFKSWYKCMHNFDMGEPHACIFNKHVFSIFIFVCPFGIWIDIYHNSLPSTTYTIVMIGLYMAYKIAVPWPSQLTMLVYCIGN